MGRYLRRLSRQAGEKSVETRAGDVGAALVELRRLAVESSDIAEPMRFFHDELVPLDAFMALGGPGEYPMLEEMLRKATQRTLPEFHVSSFSMQHLPEHALWHGAGYSEHGGILMFIYFDDLGLGLAHVLLTLTTDQNHFLRFRGVPSDLAAFGPLRPGRGERGQA
jgi:hypothetical protein